MNEEIKVKMAKVFKSHPAIKLAYLFGSQATGQAGPTSDYDFAVYAEGIDQKAENDLRLTLLAELAKLLSTDKVDLVLLDRTTGSELKFQIIKDGIILFEKEPARLLVEPRILNEYFDFRDMARRHGLTRT